MRFRLIVFDLDGTLVDSRRDLAESANSLLVECGCAPLPEETIGRMVGDGAAVLVGRVFAASNCDPPPNALARFLATYDGRLLRFTRPYPGMHEVLEALAAEARLAVLTNKPLAATHQVLAGLDLARHFPPEAVFGGDGPHPRKPDPAGLNQLVADAGVSSGEALLVGDSVIDWRTARAATTAACIARYGFGFEGFPAGELRAADWVIDRPSDLLTILQ